MPSSRNQSSAQDMSPEMIAEINTCASDAVAAYMATHDLTGPQGPAPTSMQLAAAVSTYLIANPPAPGSAASVTVGTVTTGTAGSSVIVVNSGTSSAAVLDITIPRGNTGASGTTALPNVTLAETGITLALAGVRKLTVACTGALTTDNIVVFATTSPAGYAVHDAVCLSNGSIVVNVTVPILVAGSYSITCRVLALGR